MPYRQVQDERQPEQLLVMILSPMVLQQGGAKIGGGAGHLKVQRASSSGLRGAA